jgi:transcriptional regulator with XRE-family HTH domain
MKKVPLKSRFVNSVENDALCTFLKDSRKQSGHTMRSLGDVLNVPHTVIGKIEKKDRRLDVVELLRYCQAINVDPLDAMRVLIEAAKPPSSHKNSVNSP